jgi:hypothetical protein
MTLLTRFSADNGGCGASGTNIPGLNSSSVYGLSERPPGTNRY